MSHFAKVENGIVTQVIVIEQDVVDTGLFGDPALWVQTSYNTYGGVHRLGGIPLRKNYAGIGYTYNSELDAFYAPQPYPSWTLNTDTCMWLPPVPMSIDGKMYIWNEETTSWIESIPMSSVVVEGLEPTTTITFTEVSEMIAETIPELSSDSIPALTTETISALSTSSIPALTTETISALSTGSISSLSTDSISALSTSQVSSLSTSQI
jgi:hypothetical protein